MRIQFMKASSALGIVAQILLLCFVLDALPQASAQPEDRGDFKLVYRPSSDPELDSFRELLVESRVFDKIVAGLNDLLVLPYDIVVRFEDNAEGPYYQGRKIVMNYQFLQFHSGLFLQFEYSEDPEELVDDLLDLTEFVFYHELGHALVEAYGIPILGREEDAADSLAALLAIQLDAGSMALVAADAFDMQTQLEDEIAVQEFWGSHSLNEQRMFALGCLVFGSDPEQYAGLLQEMEMPREQEERCVEQFQEKAASWEAVLSPFMKPES